MTLNFEPKVNFELDKKYIFGSNWTLCEANIELNLTFEPAQRWTLGKKLQILTLNFELKFNLEQHKKYIFGSNFTLFIANIELSLNFEPARKSKLEKCYKY